MANEILLKRRLTGDAGAPASLKAGELAWNQVDDILYAGRGDNGSGVATSILALAGPGAFLKLVDNQTVTGAKTFGDLRMSADPTHDNHAVRLAWINPLLTGLQTAVDGKAATSHNHTIADVSGLQTALNGKASTSHSHAISEITGLSTQLSDLSSDITQNADDISTLSGSLASKANATHTHGIADVTGLQSALDAKATKASPAFTGTPTVPTAATATNNTQIASTAYVRAVVAELVAAAPGTLDTLNELAAALGDNPNFATDVTASIGTKMAKSANLSDLANVATARSNLGLGTLALQNATAVAISGGSISGVTMTNSTIDSGTF